MGDNNGRVEVRCTLANAALDDAGDGEPLELDLLTE